MFLLELTLIAGCSLVAYFSLQLSWSMLGDEEGGGCGNHKSRSHMIWLDISLAFPVHFPSSGLVVYDTHLSKGCHLGYKYVGFRTLASA